MNKNIPFKLVVDTVSNEKGLSENFIFNAIEAALISATKHKYSFDVDIKIKINKKYGTYITYRQWTVVEDSLKNDKINPLKELYFNIAKTENVNIKVGDKIEELVNSVKFGRIAIQVAKQVIIQKIKSAEREVMASEFKKKIGSIITGTIKKITRKSLILDFGNDADGILKKDDILQREIRRIGDNIKVYLYNVVNYKKGPQLIVNRSSDEMLIELLKLEIPEINEGIIEIKSISREPGSRTKIAVKTNDGRIDPIGTCIGIKGTRVQAISNELYGEKIDIILWHSNPVYFVLNAMSPAIINSIIVDYDTKTMELSIIESMIPKAIGKNGQNIKLASILTKWNINIISIEEANNKKTIEIKKYTNLFSKKLNISENISKLLVNEGIRSLEELAYIPKNELLKTFEINEKCLNEIREKAKNILIFEKLNKNIMSNSEFNDLQKLQLDKKIYDILIEKKIYSIKELLKININNLANITNLSKKQCDILIEKAKKFID